MRNKEFKLAVLSAINRKSEFSYDDIVEKVKPYANYDNDALEDKQLKRDIRGVICRIRDEAGDRVILSDNKGKFINIETTEDVTALGHGNLICNKLDTKIETRQNMK